MNPEKQSALSSITATYTDSEGEPDSDVEMEDVSKPSQNNVETSSSSSDEKSSSRDKRQTLVSYASEQFEEDSGSEEDSFPSHVEAPNEDSNGDSHNAVNPRNPPLSPVSFHRKLSGVTAIDIDELLPETAGRCSKSLQDKITELYEKKKLGKDMNKSIQQRKDFRNPSIYEKLISYCNIDELGTNYPPEIYDPHRWGRESYYEELAKRQKEEMDRREKEKKERTKVEFISGTAKKPNADISAMEAGKRKSKWDVGMTQLNTTALKPATLITPTVLPVATGTKPTVISAFGTITKKLK